MATWRISSPTIGTQRITETSTTQKHPLGKVVTANDATDGVGEFIYLQGVANTVVGSWVKINSDSWTTTLATQGDVGPVAVAMSANVASQYGWYQIGGEGNACAVDVVDSGKVYIDTAPGFAKDAVSATHKVSNATWTSVDDTTVVRANVMLWRPYLALESNDT